jgi:transposase-like protein
MMQCPGCGDDQHVCGVEIPEVYDGVLYWVCTSCKKGWHREGVHTGKRFDIADEYVSGRKS